MEPGPLSWKGIRGKCPWLVIYSVQPDASPDVAPCEVAIVHRRRGGRPLVGTPPDVATVLRAAQSSSFLHALAAVEFMHQSESQLHEVIQAALKKAVEKEAVSPSTPSSAHAPLAPDLGPTSGAAVSDSGLLSAGEETQATEHAVHCCVFVSRVPGGTATRVTLAIWIDATSTAMPVDATVMLCRTQFWHEACDSSARLAPLSPLPIDPGFPLPPPPISPEPFFPDEVLHPEYSRADSDFVSMATLDFVAPSVTTPSQRTHVASLHMLLLPTPTPAPLRASEHAMRPTSASLQMRPSLAPPRPSQQPFVTPLPPPPPSSAAALKIISDNDGDLRDASAKKQDDASKAQRRRRQEHSAVEMEMRRQEEEQRVTVKEEAHRVPTSTQADKLFRRDADDGVPPAAGGEDAEESDVDVPTDDASQDDEAAIDEMFADLETAVKYMGSMLAAAVTGGAEEVDGTDGAAEPAAAMPLTPLLVVRGVLAGLAALIVVIVVVLPTFFAVLAVRMVKVEVTKENFVKRAAIIAAESAAKHAARMGRLVLRASPIIVLVLVSPPVVALGVIPSLESSEAKRTCALAYVAVFTGLVTVMQVQGTVRACVTFAASGAARAATRAAAAGVIQRWYRRARLLEPPVAQKLRQARNGGVVQLASNHGAFTLTWVTGAPASSGANASADGPSSLLLSCSVEKLTLPRVRFEIPFTGPTWHRNLGLYVAFAVEAVQLSLFGFQFLLTAPDTPFHAHLPGLDVWLPYIFFSIPDPAMARPWVAFGAVCAAVLLVSVRIVYEVGRFSVQARHVGEEAAQGEFFHSFVGSVLYGHGNPKAVPPWLCTSVHALCDVLFFTTVSSLGGAMSCFRAEDAFVARTDVACFSDAHLRGLTASLVAFGFYIPLSIMVAPVLAEANKPPSGDAVSVAKPYTMISNAMKVVAVVVTILVSYRVYPCVAVGSVLSALLLCFTCGWSGWTDFAGPATSRRVNMSRVSTMLGATLTGCVTVIAACVPSFSTASTTMGSGLIYVLVLPLMWLCHVVAPLLIRGLVDAK